MVRYVLLLIPSLAFANGPHKPPETDIDVETTVETPVMVNDDLTVTQGGNSLNYEVPRTRVNLGGTTTVSSDALETCHERTGTKNGGLFAWGGRVTINELCLKAYILIAAGRPEEAAKLVMGDDYTEPSKLREEVIECRKERACRIDK